MFVGRADDQVKVGGRRIELGEVDSALLGLPGVAGAAAAVRRTPAGTSVLVGYLVPEPGVELDLADARHRLAGSLPAALVPLLAPVESHPDARLREGRPRRAAVAARACPTRSRRRAVGLTADRRVGGGAVDRRARRRRRRPARRLLRVRRRQPRRRAAGQRAARAVPDGHRRRRLRVPADRRPGAPARRVRADRRGRGARRRADPAPGAAGPDGPRPSRSPPSSGCGGSPGCSPPTRCSSRRPAPPWVPVVPGRLVVGGARVAGAHQPARAHGDHRARRPDAAARAAPGRYPRGGSVHLRLWFTESWAAAAGAENLSCAPWTAQYARALGATSASDVDLHAPPPVTGLLTLGNGCSVEPEVDLRGHWLDGDVLQVGRVRIDKRATVGTRSTLAPGTRVGAWAEVAPGLRGARLRAARRAVGGVAGGVRRAGAAALAARQARRAARRWVAVYGVTAAALAALPVVAAACGLLVVGVGAARDATTWGEAALDALRAVPLGAVTMVVVLARRHARRGAAARARVPRGLPRGAQPARAGRSGRRCGSWTTPAPRCSRSTRASRRRCGCGRSARTSARTSRRRPPSCSRR